MAANKAYYRIREVAQLLDVPISTLRFWDSVFPQLNPTRLQSGHRRYTSTDIDLIKRIKFLLRDKKMSLEYAKNDLDKYRKCQPRCEFACKSSNDVMRLLSEIKARTEDAHIIVRVETIEKYLTNAS